VEKISEKVMERIPDKVGAVLVVGGGIAGTQCALDLADTDLKVYLVDSSPSIGGAMSQLDKTFPTHDCAMCIMAPKLVATGRHHNVELLTNSKVEKVEGEIGHFKVTVRRKVRCVDEEKCTGCGMCTQRCPVEVPDEYNKGLKVRKAIYMKYPQAVPPAHTIDQEACIGCGICETQCEAGAIDFTEEERTIDIDVGAIVLAPGFTEFDLRIKREYGYGRYPNVISSLELERMLSPTGPYGGVVLRPSNGEVPENVAFIQCVGSRDVQVGNTYCSSVCCMFAIKEATIAEEHTPGLKAHIFFMDMRAFGKEFDEYYVRAEKEHGLKFTRNQRVASIEENPETHDLTIWYSEEGEMRRKVFNLVVLSVGTDSPKGAQEIAEAFGIELNKHDFCETDIFSPLDTKVPGIFVCGAFSSPKDIPDSVAQASGAASKAMSIVASERGTLIEKKEYPPEIDLTGQDPRIGVFVCHCGINIGGVVDVPGVVEYVKGLPNVVHAEGNLYTCSQDTQENIKEKIKEHNLNRVIVASCTPRTHAPLFQSTIMEAGLNAHVFEMANIRDQCSWVHSSLPKEATEKAKLLVSMAVEKSRLLAPLPEIMIEVEKSALVIGGGLSGMTVAQELANQGIKVHLIEKEQELGGLMKRIHYGLEGEDVQTFLSKLKKSVIEDPLIDIHTGTQLKDVSGCVGSFDCAIESNGGTEEFRVGTIVVATGGLEYKPTEYLYGQDQRVMTQLEFENMLTESNGMEAKTIAMIQCVGSRVPERPYCSRICCTEAVKNALKAKEVSPDSNVYIMFRDMRTYGFREEFYTEAADEGVIFTRYSEDDKPAVTVGKDGSLEVAVLDQILNERIMIKPDILVLSAATVLNPDNGPLSQMLKVPLNKDGFFFEAHMKLRPMDFATDGIFLCGLAHFPKFFEENIAQASGAAARAMTILAKDALEAEAAIAVVDEDRCRGCGKCVETCEFNAPELIEREDGRKVSHVVEALCKGCGACSVACCNKSIQMRGFTSDQIIAMLMKASEAVQEET
jgi:heterodisulfide reductase subunit A